MDLAMKPIKDAVAYANGKRMIASQIAVMSVSDNLFDTVVFKYTLFNYLGVFAGESTAEFKYEACEAGKSEYVQPEVSATPGGTHLCKWDASAEGAYRLVCAAIGLEFVESAGKDFFEG